MAPSSTFKSFLRKPIFLEERHIGLFHFILTLFLSENHIGKSGC